ncbi:MAG TPA: hypothetical protein VG964_00385 [Candidatus Saccharimonadales bacterium]|jgi:hypothetical protein|nr:hypothetical protein [Candidatus Saccharimonadales bacterium]
MQFNEAKTRLILETSEDLDILSEVVDATAAADQKKKRQLHAEAPQASVPYELGPAATKGAMSALERVAEDSEKKFDVSDLTRTRAGHTVALLNEQLGPQRDAGLLGRIATALAKFDITTLL